MTFRGPHRRITVEPIRKAPPAPREPARPAEKPQPARKPDKTPA